MLFKDIVGQNQIKERLIQSVKQNKVAHAQLFCGPEGVGKMALALAYAQYLNCLNPKDNDACGECSSCHKYAKLIHPDLHFVFPIVQKKKEKKELCNDYLAEWRNFILTSPYRNLNQWLDFIKAENAQGMIYAKESDEILKKLSLKIYEGKYKVMIIWYPERMNQECSNKLLKLLEEPYGNTVFLLVSNNPDQIIGTIQSRAQRINIKAIDDISLKTKLQESYKLTDEVAENVAHLARGSYLKAVEVLEQSEDTELFHQLFVEMMRAAWLKNIKEIKRIAETLAAVGREKQRSFIRYSLSMFREYFVSNLQEESMVYLTPKEAQFGVKFAPFIHERNIIKFMEEFELADRHIEQNVNAKMVFLDLCLKVTLLIKN